MPKVVIERREKIFILFKDDEERDDAREWLRAYLKTTEHSAAVIKHKEKEIEVEVVIRSEKFI